MSINKKIAIGTVQFGLDYGISNTSGKVTSQEVDSILRFSRINNINTLDTAQAYGTSEIVLGNSSSQLEGFNVVSKFSKSENIKESLLNTLENLKVSSIYGYLAHNYNLFDNNVYEQLLECKKQGLIYNIGVSLYHPFEAKTVIEKYPEINIVQVPYSIFDQRFESVFGLLKEKNIIIHTRSTFLQGLVFMNPKKLPDFLFGAEESLNKLIGLSENNNIPINLLALNFVLKNPFVDKVVLGVTNVDQVRDNLMNISLNEKLYLDLCKLNITDEKIILPFNWPNE